MIRIDIKRFIRERIWFGWYYAWQPQYLGTGNLFALGWKRSLFADTKWTPVQLNHMRVQTEDQL